MAGQNDGQAEATERGATEGALAGAQIGARDGYDRCYASQGQQEYQSSYAQGSTDGNRDGLNVGANDGNARGLADGQRDGDREGSKMADVQAARDAAGPGEQQGRLEADRSDAAARGAVAGRSDGDSDAYRRAFDVEYPRGQRDVRAEMEKLPVLSRDWISQASLAQPLMASSGQNQVGVIQPDYRHYDDSRVWPTIEETDAYKGYYRNGYLDGFGRLFPMLYDQAYRSAYTPAQQAGCQKAASADYSAQRRQGYDEGRAKAYKIAYDSAYAQASKSAYPGAYSVAQQFAYQRDYQPFYQKHFELARQRGYKARYDALYVAAYDPAHTAAYAKAYSGYAASAYQAGRAAETNEFKLKPLKVLSLTLDETIPNGVFEPGEPLRFSVKVKNYAGQAIDASKVKLTVTAANASDSGKNVIISDASQLLAKNLKPQSETDVTDALGLRLTESAIKKSITVNFELTYEGRRIHFESKTITASFLSTLRLVSPLGLQEGLTTQANIEVTNQSNQPTSSKTKVKMLWNTSEVEILQPEATVGVLKPGEKKIVSFLMKGRTTRSQVDVPIAFQVTDSGSGTERRIGLMEFQSQVPVMNDYRISIDSDLSGALKGGLVRAIYKITNQNSRLVLRPLLVTLRFLSPDQKTLSATTASVIGPNPQYVRPLENKASRNFVIPVVVNQGMAKGSIFELEVQEEGEVVVIHRGVL
ncbi:MAG: hypothetical protein JNL01_09480 [Bdellovibrionales bacterium]|nr:hypothetical protein [Bdellovibrionales bacterium]